MNNVRTIKDSNLRRAKSYNATCALIAAAIISGATAARAQTVATGADLNTAINDQSGSITIASGTLTTVANTTVGSSGTVTYSTPFDGLIDFTTSIQGTDSTSFLSGNNAATPLFLVLPSNETATGAVASANQTAFDVTVSNLSLSYGASIGGAGGGAGLGGAAFVGAGASLTLDNVTVTGNKAVGGNAGGFSGGGGLGSGNTSSGVGGGGGLYTGPAAAYGGGANGGSSYDASGGFGGGGATSVSLGAGGAGGFGGGGGNSILQGGNGGFGGGAGASYVGTGTGGFGGGGTGVGGFGGGNGSGTSSGGGAAFGGAVFVQNGGSLTINGNTTLSGDTVSASNGGAAAGAEIFMMTGSSVTLDPGAFNTVTIGQQSDNTGTISDVADDSVYSITNGASTLGAGTGAALNIGTSSNVFGTVVLYGNNTYAGGTVINGYANTLVVSQDSNLGATDANNSAIGAVTIEGNGELLTNPTLNGSGSTTFSSNRAITIGAYAHDNATIAAVNGTTATYNGTISGAGDLNVNDSTNGYAGTVALAGNNTYTGDTYVQAGTLLLMNTNGSATGSGVLTAMGTTIGGYGTSTNAGFALYGANIMAGQTSAADTNTTHVLTLQSTNGGSIISSNLTFNISTKTVGQGNQLNVGSTQILFSGQNVLNLNLQGNSIIPPDSAYILIAGNTGDGSLQYSGLDLASTSTGSLANGLYTQILDSNVGGSGSLVLGLNGLANTYYGQNSYLFLYQNSTTGVDDIEVEMIPEPGTWAMMLGGLGMLIFWQRRKRKN